MLKYISLYTTVITALISLYQKNLNIMLICFPIYIFTSITFYSDILKNYLINKKSKKILKWQMTLNIILITIIFLQIIVTKHFNYPKVTIETSNLIYILFQISFLILSLGYLTLYIIKQKHTKELMYNNMN